MSEITVERVRELRDAWTNAPTSWQRAEAWAEMVRHADGVSRFALDLADRLAVVERERDEARSALAGDTGSTWYATNPDEGTSLYDARDEAQTAALMFLSRCPKVSDDHDGPDAENSGVVAWGLLVPHASAIVVDDDGKWAVWGDAPCPWVPHV